MFQRLSFGSTGNCKTLIKGTFVVCLKKRQKHVRDSDRLEKTNINRAKSLKNVEKLFMETEAILT